MNQIFITGIGTEVGKTVTAAIFTEALQANYWKPVQAGDLDHTDSHKVANWVSNPNSKIVEEAYRLQFPASPHYSADLEQIRIECSVLDAAFDALPTDRMTVIEGAGGLMVPLNLDDLYIDWLAQRKIPVVLVSRHYLGSINHTLLSVRALQAANIPILGLVFNGMPNTPTETAILHQTQLPVLLHLKEEAQIDAATVTRYATLLKQQLMDLQKDVRNKSQYSE